MNASNLIAILVFLAPFGYYVRRAHKAGELRHVLIGAAWALGIIVWAVSIAYLIGAFHGRP